MFLSNVWMASAFHCCYTHIYLPTYVDECNLFIACNLLVCVFFWADHLVLDNQLVCSSMGKTISATLSIPYLSIVLCIRLRSHELSPFHVSMSTGFVLVKFMFRQPCLGDLMVIVCSTLIFRRHNFTVNFLFYRLL